jgi:poly(A) polymerase
LPMTIVSKKDLTLSLNPKVVLLLIQIEDFLTKHGIQGYIVGGFVRDVLLNRETADVDIALSSNALKVAPEIAIALGGKYVLLDKVNKVGRVILKETAHDKSQWQIDLSTIRDGIEQDLRRRDFTIDAMAISLNSIIEGKTTAEIIDPFNGWEDLRQGVIRNFGHKSFESDALRMLRGVRLASELGFTISQHTEELIRQKCQLIIGIASERVREELLRLLAASRTGQHLLYLDDLGLITALIPELAQARGLEQPKEHFWDVFQHSVKAVDAVDFILRQGDWEYAGNEALSFIPWSAELEQHFNSKVSSGSTRRLLLKLAALLHDIAKPQTKIIDEKGRTRFYGHAREGAQIATTILERLRFSTKEVKLVAGVVRYHLRPVQISQNELPSQRAIYRYFRDSGEAAIDTLFFSLADHLATRGPNLDMANWRQHANLIDYILTQRFKQESIAIPSKLINGHDLIKNFDLAPGPKVGELLKAVREAQASAEVTTREEAISYVNYLLTGGNTSSSLDRK